MKALSENVNLLCMILREFPNLQWLKQKINQRFQDRQGYNSIPLETDGFPSVIINAKATASYRPDIVGPVSLFLNLKGESRCSVDNKSVVIPPDYFFISNRFQPYTLEIESHSPVETFNIHFGEVFSEGVFSALLTPADIILNNAVQQKAVTVAFYNQLYRRDEIFNQLLNKLQATQQPGDKLNKLLFEEVMAQLLFYLLQQHRDLMQQVTKLPALKQSTRIELYKRLSFALDYLHAHAAGEVDLDALAASACLSKYHFLRLFKQAHKVSPYQYLQQLRLEKAKQLLKGTALPVHEIAESLGFENSNSFSRLFLQRMKVYPTQYRLASN